MQRITLGLADPRIGADVIHIMQQTGQPEWRDETETKFRAYIRVSDIIGTGRITRIEELLEWGCASRQFST